MEKLILKVPLICTDWIGDLRQDFSPALEELPALGQEAVLELSRAVQTTQPGVSFPPPPWLEVSDFCPLQLLLLSKPNFTFLLTSARNSSLRGDQE